MCFRLVLAAQKRPSRSAPSVMRTPYENRQGMIGVSSAVFEFVHLSCRLPRQFPRMLPQLTSTWDVPSIMPSREAMELLLQHPQP